MPFNLRNLGGGVLFRLHNKAYETLIFCLPFSILSSSKMGRLMHLMMHAKSGCEVRPRGHLADDVVNNSSVIHTTVPSASSNTRGCSHGWVSGKLINAHITTTHTLGDRPSHPGMNGLSVCVFIYLFMHPQPTEVMYGDSCDSFVWKMYGECRH